ncbi:TPR-like protein [Trametopsis cervina]|nr:TPR-like protein [Trametopsis cervina]
MSLQGLISGSECAVPFNPLSQVLKHTEGDRSIQQDRIAGPSSSQLRHLPGTAASAAADHDLAMARQFFEGNASSPMAGPTFASHHIPPPELASHTQSHDLNRAWGNVHERKFMQYNTAMGDMKPQEGWANEFGSSVGNSVSSSTPIQVGTTQRPSYMTNSMFGMGSAMGMRPMNFNPTPVLAVSDKGKGKSRDIDFDAAFAAFDQQLGPTPQETARIEELDDTADLAAAMSGATLHDATPDFKGIWDQMQTSDIPPAQEEMAKWEAEYNQLMHSSVEDWDYDYGSTFTEAYKNGLGEEKSKLNDDGLPILGSYVFETQNKYMDPSSSSRSYLADAKVLLEQGGSLTEVALMLEAAVQKGDLGVGGWEAWVMLGEVRSMDEREEAGMRALTEGVKRAEAAGAAGEGMLSLAISFINESYDRATHNMLLQWLRARYPDHHISEEAWKSLSLSSWHAHEQVTETFINLAREQHSRGQLDADVQIALGVLFYANSQFDRGKDCFEAALSVRPKDYLLWNRLGSCLSNDNKPEEALGAYREALQLRPTYTRAIYNVGVACLNIGAHKEAAEHFLSALAMQESTGGTKSDQIWTTLHRTLTSMDRPDLAEKAKAGSDLSVFRGEGFDF